MRVRPPLPIAIYALLLTGSAQAQWLPNGTPLCTQPDFQSRIGIVIDGAGGAIAAWLDYRIVPTTRLYAQRINASGTVQWTADGKLLCTADAIGQTAVISPDIASDGAGGAIVVYERHFGANEKHVFAQRVNSAGVLAWGVTDGVALCLAPDGQDRPVIVADGTGGAIVTWRDFRAKPTGGYNLDIYAQRIDAGGVVQWATDGVALCTDPGSQYDPVIVSDGANGAIVAWDDYRGSRWHVYAQRVDASGVVQWTADGVALCSFDSSQTNVALAPNGNGGAVVAWQDRRIYADAEIYAQAVDANGVVLWSSTGVPVCADPLINSLYPQVVVAAGGGVIDGAIVSWLDSRLGASIYAQRLDNVGNPLWTVNGVAVGEKYPVFEHGVTGDGSFGAIFAIDGPDRNIYAQRLDATGVIQWTPQGVPVCSATGVQHGPVIVSDATGTVIGWNDLRDEFTGTDIYASKIGLDGTPADVRAPRHPASLALDPNFPNPFGTTTSLEFRLETGADVEIGIYDVAGRRMREIRLGRMGAGARQIAFDGLDDAGRLLPSGVYFYRVRAAGETVSRKMVIAR